MVNIKSKYLSEQIITYIGNKRQLLGEINNFIINVKEDLGKNELVCADLFSGTGIVARLLKYHSKKIIANDLEYYSYIVNECFLSNKSEFDEDDFNKILIKINKKCLSNPVEGVLCKFYAPLDDNNIKKQDRVFYNRTNAIYIDSFRHYIDIYSPEKLKKYFLALLITEASIHVNTSGVFKGFYKDKNTGIGKFGGTAANALQRILGEIKIETPNLCEKESKYEVLQGDAIELSNKLRNIDLVYLDPPYNQHPYGSNYFMLNLIAKNEEPNDISPISGIPKKRNHSPFNKKNDALFSMEKIIKNLKTKYILISYNNEGFITYDEMFNMLIKYGFVTVKQIKYNTFRGSRNLRERDIHTNEFLFLLKKEI